MTDHARQLLMVLVLLGLVMTSRLWGRVYMHLRQQRLSTLFVEGDQLLLWGGLLLSALGSGLLVLYLLLQP